MTALAAIAASMALPPSSRMWAPAWDARNCGVETMPNFETTIERPCPGTEENCCAGKIVEWRISTARHAKRFISTPMSSIGGDGHLETGQRFGEIDLARQARGGFLEIGQLSEQLELIALRLREAGG